MSLEAAERQRDGAGSTVEGSATLRAYVELEQMIRRGEIAAGERLPSERRLSERLGVSRGTIRQALSALEQRQIVEAIPNSGWFATDNRLYVDENELRSFTEMAHERGLTPSSAVIDVVERPATFEESNRLRVAPTTPVVQLERVRYFDDRPVCVHVAVVPTNIADADRMRHLVDGSLHRTMEAVGRIPSRAAYSMRAAACGAETARLLDLVEGSPVLIAEEVVFDQTDQPIQVNELTYRADAYRFEASLYRRPTRRSND